MARALAVAMSSPFKKSLLIFSPSPVYAPPPFSSQPAGGCTVRTMGRPWSWAKSQSRSSSAGTAMMAPVP